MRAIVLGVIVLLLIAAGVFAYSRGARLDIDRLTGIFGSEQARIAVLEKTALADPTSGVLYKKMKEALPDEFDAILKSAVANPGETTNTRMRRVAEQFNAFIAAHAVEARQATPPVLAKLLDNQSAIRETLQIENPRLCGSMAYLDLARVPGTPPQTRARMREATELLLDAIHDARNSKHVYEPLADRDAAALTPSMRRDGITNSEFVAMNSGSLDSLSITRRCALMVSYFRAISQQDELLRARVVVFTMIRP